MLFRSFNSIKVRLILIYPIADLKKMLFQFHKGSINTSKYNYYRNNIAVSIP